MTKWSNFIRNLGTAGPSTVQGIYDLGFALRSEIPALFAKYLRVDAAQTFTGPEKTQGRANLGVTIGTDVQAYDAGLQSLAGLTTLADRLTYLTAPDVYALTDFTAFARTLLDDVDAAAARATLALGNVDNTSDANKPISTAQQTALNLKAPLASPTFTGDPKAPTPAVGDNDASVATTAFVRAEFANLLNAGGGRPSLCLPCLGEFRRHGHLGNPGVWQRLFGDGPRHRQLPGKLHDRDARRQLRGIDDHGVCRRAAPIWVWRRANFCQRHPDDGDDRRHFK